MVFAVLRLDHHVAVLVERQRQVVPLLYLGLGGSCVNVFGFFFFFENFLTIPFLGEGASGPGSSKKKESSTGLKKRKLPSLLGGGLIKYTVLIKYTGVIKYTARKPILSVEICEIKYTVFVYIFLTKKFFQQVLHKKSKNFFFDFGGPDSVRAVMGSLCAEKRVFLTYNACISFYTIGADGVQICENLSHQKIVHFSTLTPPLAGIGPKMSMVVFSRGFGH